MVDGMGTFRTSIAVAPLDRPFDRRELANVLVDTGSEYNWIPRQILEELGIEPMRVERFQAGDGRIVKRETGGAFLYAGGRAAPTIVVFGGPKDLTILGAIGLEGLNLRVDLVRKELVPAGPVLWAAMSAA
jgi:predicted aspartyl protease